jgi:hypothetical protein
MLFLKKDATVSTSQIKTFLTYEIIANKLEGDRFCQYLLG